MNFNSECECECEWEHVKRVFLGVLKCVSERGHGDSREAGGSEAAGAAGLGDRVECDRREDSHARVAADSQVTLLSLLSFACTSLRYDLYSHLPSRFSTFHLVPQKEGQTKPLIIL